MSIDLNKSISAVSYNILNLPSHVTIDGVVHKYTYSADGRKLKVEQGTFSRDYVGSVIYENGSLKRIMFDGGYWEGGTYYYLNDHLGNTRVVASGTGTVHQRNEYYPFGMPMAETVNAEQNKQPYKFGGKEFDRKNGLKLMDFGARNYDPAIARFTTMDRFAEKYYSMSPYQYAANNPINIIDVNGDSLYIADRESILAIYHGLEDGANIKLNFNNGVLDPSSIREAAENSSDFFFKDLYEIASHPTMVELSTSNNNTYMLDGKLVREEFMAPVDDDTSSYGSQYQNFLKNVGEPLGKSITGNLGQTLMPGNISASGKSSTNGNVQVIINGKGTINHQTIGIAHEWGHVLLYLSGRPYGHIQPGVDQFVYDRATKMSKRLGYDY